MSGQAEVELTGTGLRPAEVVEVARRSRPVAIADSARDAMAASAAIGERLVDSGEPAYGVSTGFGSLATVPIPAERREQLQRSLLRSHAAGMGDSIEPEVVRAMMLLRARSLAMGYSGCRPEVAEMIAALLNAGLTPVVPEHGSLGASGDLAPLAHCGLALMGEGEIDLADGGRRPAAEALAAAGIAPLTLTAKEGLALINGTDGILAMLVLASWDLRRFLQVADVTFDPIGLRPWVMTALVWVVVVGFPIALFLSWRYDLTSDHDCVPRARRWPAHRRESRVLPACIHGRDGRGL